MIKITNNNYDVEIDSHGSQLTKIINKNDNYNYLWNGSQWPKHAPLLFPAIGKSNNDSYLINGKTFNMPQHGFAADQEFTVVTQTKNSVVMETSSNTETKKLYPFDFKLQVSYYLLSSGLSINFSIKNLGETKMPFSIGSHPAFNVPINNEGKFDDYEIELLGNQDNLKVYEIIKNPYPFRTGKINEISSENKHVIKLNHKLFDPGLRIIANQDINKVILHIPENNHSISLLLSDFKNVCLWTKEDEALPFLCIEPFNGLPDIEGEPIDWFKKEGNIILDPKEEKDFQYEIIFS